jgi:hypothetical protein
MGAVGPFQSFPILQVFGSPVRVLDGLVLPLSGHRFSFKNKRFSNIFFAQLSLLLSMARRAAANHVHDMINLPSKLIVYPVIYPASSEHRKASIPDPQDDPAIRG